MITLTEMVDAVIGAIGRPLTAYILTGELGKPPTGENVNLMTRYARGKELCPYPEEVIFLYRLVQSFKEYDLNFYHWLTGSYFGKTGPMPADLLLQKQYDRVQSAAEETLSHFIPGSI